MHKLSPDAEKLLLAMFLQAPEAEGRFESIVERLLGFDKNKQMELRKELISHGFIEPKREEGSQGFA